jgi:hypothetical protein
LTEEVPVPSVEFRAKWAGVANAVASAARAARPSRPGSPPSITPDSGSETIAAWLQWNDPNGAHTAELADAEGFDPYDLGTAWDVLATTLADEEDILATGALTQMEGTKMETCSCETCGKLTPMLGTKRCDACWELEHRLADYLRDGGENARRFVAAAVERARPEAG